MCGAPRSLAGRWAFRTFLAGLARQSLAEEGVPDVIRGVAPADLPKYRPKSGRDGGPSFRCFDSRGSAASVDLPYAAVNDDSCDCADGSDEPGTDACAGQSTTLFFCRNEQSDAAYIYASRVNDGICDCCDGSDEWRAAASGLSRMPCQNTCLEEGQRLSKERAQKEAELRGGVERRGALVAAAAEEKRALEEELKRLKAELPPLEALERKAKSALDRAQRLGKREEEEEPAADAPAPAAPPVEVAAAAPEAAAAGDGPVVSEYAKWMEGAGEVATAAPEAAPAAQEAAAGDGPVVSEYAKWMEGGGEAAAEPSPPTPAPPLPPASKAPPPPPPPASKPRGKAEGFFARFGRKVSETFDRLWNKEPPPPLPEAQQAHTDAEDKLNRSKDRKGEIEKKLGHMQDAASLVYSNLVGRCLSLKVSEYTYEVCFFDRATQEGQSTMTVGNWGKWAEPGVALFENGEMCPGGPARSLKVRFRCGSSEEVLDASEPSRCAYEAHATHPGACTEEQLEALLNRGPRRPTDEL